MADTLSTYRTVTPYLLVPDGQAELDFLARAFQAAEVQVSRTPDGAVAHAEVRIGDTLVMIGQAGGPWTPKAAALYLWVLTSMPPMPLRWPPAPRRRASRKTSRTATATPASSILAATPGGLAARSRDTRDVSRRTHRDSAPPRLAG